QRDGLRADLVAEVDLHAGWGEYLAIADDPRAVRLRTGDVFRIRYGLACCERRRAQPRRHQAGERTQTLDPGLIPRVISRFSGHVSSSSLKFFPHVTGIGPATSGSKEIQAICAAIVVANLYKLMTKV